MDAVSSEIYELIGERRALYADRGLALWQNMAGVEVRGMDGGTGDGSYTMTGEAAVFDARTTLYDSSFLRITEDLAPHAFTAALERTDLLVHLNHGHDMNSAVATTDVPANEIGGLELRQTATGLRFFARTDSEDPDARSMAVKMYRRVVAGASFKFRIGNEDRTETTADDKTFVHYRINEVSELFDVCACAQGAYRQATSTLRSALDALTGRTDEVGQPRRSEEEGVIQAAREAGLVASERAAERQREILRIRAFREHATSHTRK